MLTALIMAGGKGTRFWPLSTEEKPKQFLSLIGEKTMIQMTVNRIKPIIPIEKIFICTVERYVDLIKEQLPELPERNIIVEPEGRNTAPSIALSAFIIKKYYKNATMAVLPSDHLINDEDEFRKTLTVANEFVLRNNKAIVTLGMRASRPEIGYGYIKYNNKEENLEGYKVIKVEKFVEKPVIEKAKAYLKEGNYLWNGGMFLWSIDNIINQIKKYSLNTYEALNKIDEVSGNQLQKFINVNYSKTEAISIDYAVLEKSDDIYVIPSDFGWDDIGTWKSIERYRSKDENDNIISKNVRVIESRSNLAINKEKEIIMIGVKDIMTVETDDKIFIVDKEYMDRLRDYQNII